MGDTLHSQLADACVRHRKEHSLAQAAEHKMEARVLDFKAKNAELRATLAAEEAQAALTRCAEVPNNCLPSAWDDRPEKLRKSFSTTNGSSLKRVQADINEKKQIILQAISESVHST